MGWIKVRRQAAYTCQHTCLFFTAGILPCVNEDNAEPIFDREKQNVFQAMLNWTRSSDALYQPLRPAILQNGFIFSGIVVLALVACAG